MRTFLIALTVSALCGCSLYFDGEGERKGKLGSNLDAGSTHPCPDGPADGGSWQPDAGNGLDGGSYASGPDGGSDGGVDPCGPWHPYPDGGWPVDGGVAPDAP